MNQSSSSSAEKTRTQLLEAAESLFLRHGIDEVSVRNIIREAGQKNQSALQYHFGNRAGLMLAIQARRMQQVEDKRSALIYAAVSVSPVLDLRDACALLIRAPFELCREDKSFRHFLGLFGQRLVASDDVIASAVEGPHSDSRLALREVILGALGHLPVPILDLRVENANSLGVLAISRRARLGGSFRGKWAELFFNNLVDQIAGMLSAPVSEATSAYLD